MIDPVCGMNVDPQRAAKVITRRHPSITRFRRSREPIPGGGSCLLRRSPILSASPEARNRQQRQEKR
jgi:hypothetical protein